jgi:hypothetical protein
VRDKVFHAMAYDTSALPSELLSLRIRDIFFKKAANAVQYAEVLVTGKTKSYELNRISGLRISKFVIIIPLTSGVQDQSN